MRVPVFVDVVMPPNPGDHCNSDCAPALDVSNLWAWKTKAAVAHIVPPMVPGFA